MPAAPTTLVGPAPAAPRGLLATHRRFHGRGSALALAVGLMINLGGLSSLTRILIGH